MKLTAEQEAWAGAAAVFIPAGLSIGLLLYGFSTSPAPLYNTGDLACTVLDGTQVMVVDEAWTRDGDATVHYPNGNTATVNEDLELTDCKDNITTNE